jgi:YegS/Rv2252/BmrU family lipid kinase
LTPTTSPKYKIIVNPRSGRGRGASAAPIVRRVFQEAGATFDLVETHAAGHARQLAYQAACDGWDIIATVGGDGTAHEALQGLVQAGEQRGDWQARRPIGTLSLIPLGTGNDYAWRLGIPQNDPEAACRLLLQDHRRVVDMGQVTDETGRTEFFLNHLGAGFEAATAIETLKMQHLRGFVLYLTAVLRVIPRYSRGWATSIRYNGTSRTQPLILASVANGGRTGGGFMMAPGAELDDGQLDLVMGHTPNMATMFWLLPHVMRGTHVSKTKYVTAVRTPDLVLESADGIPVHLDGEIFRTDARHLAINVLPSRLRVIGAPRA